MEKRFSVIAVTVLFAGLLIFASTKGYLEGATNILHATTAPVSIFFSGASDRVSGFFGGIFSLGKIQRDNAELRNNLNKLQAEVAQLAEAKKENESLRRELGFTTSHNYSYEAAEVLAFDPSNVRGMVTVNKGAKNGLKNGMAVISDGFLVGRVSEVSENTSKIQLIVDPTSAIPVTLQSTDTNGLASGQIGFGLTMDKIAQGEQIKEGDTVITSGLGGEIPKGLILGTVEKITRQENSLFVSAKVRPSANLASLFRVIVIKG